MKIIIPAGTGQVGTLLRRGLERYGHEVWVLSRSQSDDPHSLLWDAKTLGPWTQHLDGADVVINLAGRSVNCRYTEDNLRQMMDSRVDSTRVIGEAIAQAQNPPALWLQMSTATIYAHRFDAPNNEDTGRIGSLADDTPAYYQRSVEIAKAWERTLDEANTPHTRKIAMRTAMVMSPDPEGVFDVLLGLALKGLGGRAGNGKQYVSFIHEHDMVEAVRFLIDHDELSGPVNLSAPEPLPQKDFAAILRQTAGVRVGLPAMRWMLEIGAFFMRTDTELLLKSRRVVPGRLLDAGFSFAYPTWAEAAQELVSRSPRIPRS